MFRKRLFPCAAALAAVMLLLNSAQAVNIETVPVGNLGNDDDTHGNGYGGVDYEYRIGKYEVTAGQYTEFLNAVAATDPHGLYSSNMAFRSNGCRITQNGTNGSYTYDFSSRPSGTEADWADRPVNYVSWYNAAMFANWLTSGDIDQGAYDTSVGAGWGSVTATDYEGITAHDSDDMDNLASTYGTVYVIPTEDEWYKAAYHKNDGVTGNYFDFPTSSDYAPGYVNNSGNLSGTGTPFTDGVTDPGNYATYDRDGHPAGIGSPYYRTEVGEWENSHSPYGTFDQGGNVWEWNEGIYGSSRGLRGGSFTFSDEIMRAWARSGVNPSYDGDIFGFRVASIPEPSTLALAALGLLGLAFYAWRRKR